MSEGVNVRFTGRLQDFIRRQVGPNGLYNNASEYIRDLVRRDYERAQRQSWAFLLNELKPGMQASRDAFVTFDPEEIIAEAKARKSRGA